MDCTECSEALSARLDGEESPAERDAIDLHLASCAACRAFAEEAAHVTRLARTAVATQEPDVLDAVLTAAPRPRPRRRRHLVTTLRVLLALVGFAQIAVAFVEMIGAHASEPGLQQVMLQGASIAHFADEGAAWNLALGVGFLWVAQRSARTSGMVPTLVAFVSVLAVLVVRDAMAGGVDALRLLTHGLVLMGVILVIVLDRLPRSPGGTVPGVPLVRQRRSGSSRRVERALDPRGARCCCVPEQKQSNCSCSIIAIMAR